VLLDVKMAWRNIWRNPRRTLLTISAIAFACILLVFMLSFQFGSYDTMINSSVKINTGHLQIQAEGYNENRKMRLVVSEPETIGQALSKVPEIEAFTSRSRSFALASSLKRTYGAMIVGIDPASEARVSTLGTIVREGNYLSNDGPSEGLTQALVGRLLARNLGVGLDDEITILGQGRDGSVAATVVRVHGIFDSGMDTFDRSTIQIPLPDFQEVFTMEKAVHEVVVLGHSLADVPVIKDRISGALSENAKTRSLVVLDWDELMPGLKQAIHMDLVSGAFFYLILIMVVAFSILNTFLMAILERTHEFGIMMAMGTRPGRLTRLVLTESAGMTLVGVAVGILLGCMLTTYFQAAGIDLSGSSEILSQYGIPSRLYPRLTLLSATAGPLVVLLITLAAALYPALKIRRLKPVEAMNVT
jgi:ABC-type lipoprotein release transport system permease subunit